jgi:hypothetical protein
VKLVNDVVALRLIFQVVDDDEIGLALQLLVQPDQPLLGRQTLGLVGPDILDQAVQQVFKGESGVLGTAAQGLMFNTEPDNAVEHEAPDTVAHDEVGQGCLAYAAQTDNGDYGRSGRILQQREKVLLGLCHAE